MHAKYHTHERKGGEHKHHVNVTALRGNASQWKPYDSAQVGEGFPNVNVTAPKGKVSWQSGSQGIPQSHATHLSVITLGY